MSHSATFYKIKDILRAAPKPVTDEVLLEVASLAIAETLGERVEELDTEIKWDSHIQNDLMLDSLDMVELVMFLEECFAVEIPDEEAGHIVTVGDAIEVIKKCKANKGKTRRIDTSKYDKNKNVIPHPDSPMMSKKPLEQLNKTLPSDADLTELP